MRKAAVIDLDQTFVTVNTFKEYVKYILRVAAAQERYGIIAKVGTYVIKRKLRLITHEQMKKHILECTTAFFKGKEKNFVARLARFTNPAIMNMMKGLKNEGYYLCLSTAAPESYSAPFAEEYEFDGYVATSTETDDSWHENYRDNKCASTLTHLKVHDAVIDILATDHYDDIPLLRVKKAKNYLVNPSKTTIKKVKAEGIMYVTLS